MAQALVNGRVLIDGQLRPASVILDGGTIAGVVAPDAASHGAERVDLGGAILAPGFVDTQVNGGGGVLFNDAPTVDGIAAIGAAHRAFGTTGFLPTLITDDLAAVRRAVAAVEQAIAAGVPGVLGIHIEGPFLNPERKGIHRPELIRALDEEGFRAVTALRGGRTLVTLAPERADPAMLGRLAAAGVVLAAGHSDATHAEAAAGFDAGITGVTHLFNAMSQLGSREPGMVGATLERSGVIAGIIVDGHHVAPATLRLALRAKPADQFMLVTDAMPSVGTDADGFDLQGRRITVRDGICTDAAGTLAGSHLDMAGAVRNAVTLLGLPLESALAMAAEVPARFLRLEHQLGRIAPGYRADLVLLDDALGVRETWIAGVPARA
jgi:N-acetylglucosamine-6-phosphate deacetylase